MIREPAVAGQFYSAHPEGLRKSVLSFIGSTEPSLHAMGVVAPHAGYVYSGPVAGATISRVKIKDTCIILGPNHTGYGSGVSIATEGSWETPLGLVPIESTLAERIQKASGIIDSDEEAHAFEHSIEVQLPFIQYLFKDSAKFVPICMMMQDLRTSREIAKSIAEQLKGKDILIIASSDFTHYEPQDAAVRKDEAAIEAITRLDDARLNELGESGKVTMCGYGPITTLIATAKLLGGVKAELLTHKTSGDITGDKSAVVGYSSIVFSRE
jgi:AmmeMemoRadiSam system protein B